MAKKGNVIKWLFVALLVLLGVFAWLGISAAIHFAYSTKARTDILAIQDALEAYRTEYGSYPDVGASNLIGVLRGDNPKTKVFLAPLPAKSGRTLDPWGQEYRIRLRASGAGCYVFSKGRDRIEAPREGEGDDIYCMRSEEVQQIVAPNGP